MINLIGKNLKINEQDDFPYDEYKDIKVYPKVIACAQDLLSLARWNHE